MRCVYYWGPGLAGTFETVTRLAGRRDGGATERDIPASVAGVQVTAFSSTVAKWLYYPVGTNDRRPVVRAQVERLSKTDGVVFMFDSQRARHEANVHFWQLLESDLRAFTGRELDTMPLVVQANKRDLPNILPMAEIRAFARGRPVIESIATLGVGTAEALRTLVELMRGVKR